MSDSPTPPVAAPPPEMSTTAVSTIFKHFSGQNLWKKYYTAKYRKNTKMYQKEIRRVDKPGTPKIKHEVFPYPLVLKYSNLFESATYKFTLDKSYYTLEHYDPGSSELREHILWEQDMEKKVDSFRKMAMANVKTGCSDNKRFVNMGLLAGCHHYLLGNKFKYLTMQFTTGDDEVSFYYSLNFFSDRTMTVSKEIVDRFTVDEGDNVQMEFYTDAPRAFISIFSGVKDMYVIVKAKLLTEMDDDDGGAGDGELANEHFVPPAP